jgi:hypothetical protein
MVEIAHTSDVVGQYYPAMVAGIAPATDYRILACRGCSTVYFQTTTATFGAGPEDVRYWPPPSKRVRPNWLWKLWKADRDLADLFGDIYTAMDGDLGVLAAIGVRTVFDRASELLGVDPAQTFAEKLTALTQLGKVGTDERFMLDVLIDAGGAAAHRGWKPSWEELDAMMGIIEQFLYRAFILPAQAQELHLAVPPKPKRRR